ncbi:hypothetical protein HMPREF9005_2047 [Actinomyces sp. oral taxon 178 str. F0338]|nr:hypothetical protein HMPREF9005_2047 [Actinomyces sp. oral taxon 178 str. F0338]
MLPDSYIVGRLHKAKVVLMHLTALGTPSPARALAAVAGKEAWSQCT